MTFIIAFLQALYELATDTGNFLETGELMLIGEDFELDPDLVVGDLVAPVYTTYANAAIAAWTPAVDGQGIPYISAAPAIFSPTAGTGLPVLIYGAAILDANGDLVAVSKFPSPLQLSFATQQLHVTAKVKLGLASPVVIEAYVE